LTGCNVSDAFAKLIEMAARAKIRALHHDVPLEGGKGQRSASISLQDHNGRRKGFFSKYCSC